MTPVGWLAVATQQADQHAGGCVHQARAWRALVDQLSGGGR